MPDLLEATVYKFTFKVALDRLYTPEGVWARYEEGRLRVGLSDFAQQRSGDVAFAEIKPVGTQVKTGEEIAGIETIKVNLGVGSPAAGRIVEINLVVEAEPETINLDPYGKGWLACIEPLDWENDRRGLMEARDYFEYMKRLAEDEAG